MMAGVGAGAGPLVHGADRTGVVDTGLGGGLLGICAEGTMVTLGGNAAGVSLGTLGESAGQSGWEKTAGEGRGALRAGAVGGLAAKLEKCGRVFGWRIIDCRSALQTGLEWGVRDPRQVHGQPWWRRLWSFRMGQVNCEGKTLQFWRYVWRGYAECRRGDISSGKGRVRGTTH